MSNPIHTGDTQVGQLVRHAIRPQLSVLNKHLCKCLMINTSIYCYMFEACDMMGTELYLHGTEVCTSYSAGEELQEGTVCVLLTILHVCIRFSFSTECSQPSTSTTQWMPGKSLLPRIRKLSR